MSLLCSFPLAMLCLGLHSTTFIPTLTVCSLYKWPDSITGNIWTMSSALGFQTLLSLVLLSLALLNLASLSLASLSLLSSVHWGQMSNAHCYCHTQFLPPCLQLCNASDLSSPAFSSPFEKVSTVEK